MHHSFISTLYFIFLYILIIIILALSHQPKVCLMHNLQVNTVILITLPTAGGNSLYQILGDTYKRR